MTKKKFAGVVASALSILTVSTPVVDAASGSAPSWKGKQTPVKHVLLISIDGMHALDFANCTRGLASINNGDSFCPTIKALTETGVSYTQALASRPSDSFPGTAALMTGGTSRSHGFYYDVAYDHSLAPPAQTTPAGIVGAPGLCPGTVGTQVGFDESIDVDSSKLDGGGAINPNYLPRDPKNGCKPVYPHQFIRVNTIFEVVKQAGGYTAWSDKHLAYDFPLGPSGQGVDDLWSPEINSHVVGLPTVQGCETVVDPNGTDAWVNSFENVKCYDKLKTNAILNEISGKNHDGSKTTAVPTLFGMNFQTVSVGQKLVEKAIGMTGGYLDTLGTPSPALLGEIEFTDQQIGRMVSKLKEQGLFDSTLIIISAKHGQSPIDPHRINRIPADDPNGKAPSDVLGGIGTGLTSDTTHIVAQALEDDVSLIWLTDHTKVTAAVEQLEQNESVYGGGEIFAGRSLTQMFNDPFVDPRTPDIIIAPNVGTVYTGGKKKIAEHGGFANDDRNVMLLVSNPHINTTVYNGQVETRQIAPTIIKALGLNPQSLQSVQQEQTQVLPNVPFTWE